MSFWQLFNSSLFESCSVSRYNRLPLLSWIWTLTCHPFSSQQVDILCWESERHRLRIFKGPSPNDALVLAKLLSVLSTKGLLCFCVRPQLHFYPKLISKTSYSAGLWPCSVALLCFLFSIHGAPLVSCKPQLTGELTQPMCHCVSNNGGQFSGIAATRSDVTHTAGRTFRITWLNCFLVG